MAASQRVRSRVPAPQRSIVPSVPGIPAGAAVLIAVASTFLGFLIDANGDGEELTGTFAATYVAGCVAAVLAVRYRGLFTTMVLPPLLLFVAVPLSYQQLTGRSSTGLKDVLLNLAIPLVDRFPTMILATVLVLAIGGLRFYLHRHAEAEEGEDETRRGSSWSRSSSTAGRPRPAKGAKSGRRASGKGTSSRDSSSRDSSGKATSGIATAGKGPAGKGTPGKGTPSRGPARKGSPSKSAKADAESLAEISKRRARRPKPEPIVDLSDQKTDKYEPPRPGRRPTGEVADTPPRITAKGRPREAGPTNGRAARPVIAAPRAEGEPPRARSRREAPPHPQPNVRYREPDAPNERRKPENL